jgi:DNA-binding NarL/FixJ family response regulator
MNETKILIVEDEPLIAEDIAEALQRNDYVVSAIVYSKEDALLELNHNLPDVALLDINLNGGMEGIEIANTIAACYGIPFIFLTSYSDKKTVALSKVTEPAGYIVKPFTEAGLYSSLEVALYNYAQKNKRNFPDLKLAVINQQLATPISEREFELLQLIYDGHSNKQIAADLFISLNTVKKHINSLYLKLDVSSHSSAIARIREITSKGNRKA